MSTEKAFIFTVEDPREKQTRTFLIQRFVDEELTPKFEIAALTGKYKTRTQFYEAYESGVSRFDLITLYGADFRRLIEKCESLEEP